MVNNITSAMFEAQLRILRQNYIDHLPHASKQIIGYEQQLRDGKDVLTAIRELRRIAHSLAGSGASYGCTAISEHAGKLDRHLQSLDEMITKLSDNEMSAISELIAPLQQAIAEDAKDPNEEFAEITTESFTETSSNRSLIICEQDLATAEDLARQISIFGYTIEIFANLTQLRANGLINTNTVVILSIQYIEEIERQPLTSIDGSVPTIIFTAPRDSFATRLRAVRAGSAAFCTTPIDITTLIDSLDNLVESRETEAFRIMIVEDQPLLAATYATTLRQAGLVVATVTNPLRVMAALSEFQPDVLLLDMYMPGCTGIELAAVLRQQSAYVGIPIIFLSAETQMDRQMEALRRGGDDFLTKPIQLDHLVTAVRSRAQRARQLRAAMVRDSLTRLYNHTTIKEHLNRESARAIRQQRPLIFAMIDIDSFKTVNDTYGHVMGDHVIKSLSRLMQQRLRRSDIIGRYGGEEFAIILPDTNVSEALHVLDELRERFAQVRYHADDATFTLTFSGGLASLSSYPTPATLVAAADRALYDAKANGRNRIVTAKADSTTNDSHAIAQPAPSAH